MRDHTTTVEETDGAETREQRRLRARAAKKAATKAAVPRPTIPNAREWFDIYMRHAGQIPDEVLNGNR